MTDEEKKDAKPQDAPACEVPAGGKRRIRPVALLFGMVFVCFGAFYIVQQVKTGQTPWLGGALCAYGLYRMLVGLSVLPPLTG